MPRRPKTALIYAVCALYAGTMLFGQGLHLLACVDLDDAGAGHGDVVLVGPIAQMDGARPCVGQSHAHHGHHADCAICQFHSQGQVASPEVESCVGPLVGTELSCLASPLDIRGPRTVYSCRAPRAANFSVGRSATACRFVRCALLCSDARLGVAKRSGVPVIGGPRDAMDPGMQSLGFGRRFPAQARMRVTVLMASRVFLPFRLRLRAGTQGEWLVRPHPAL